MRIGLLFIPLMAMAVSACGRNAEAQASSKPADQAKQGHYIDDLRKLPMAAQNATLFRAIADSGESCTGVAKSAYQQDFKGMGMWVAHCREGQDWAVFVSQTGYVQARACPTAHQSGFPACKPL